MVGGLSAVCLILACPGGGGGGGGQPTVVTFTIAGRTFRFQFGEVGRVDTQANVRTQPRAAGFTLFNQAPATTPPTGTMSVRSSDVTVGRLLTAKGAERYQAVPNGTATVTFSIASGQSAALCDTATLLAEYDVVITGGAASITNDVYDLSSEALAIIATNDVTICIEVFASFGGQLILSEFSLSFGGGSTDTAGFTLRNADERENIHILLPGEDFADENRITPGSTVTTTLSGVSVGDVISIRAGRNGTVLDTTTCPTVSGSGYTATAEWDGAFVTCEAEQGPGEEPPPTQGTELQVPIDALGQREKVTNTYNGIDYAVVGVMDVNSSTAFPATLPSNITSRLSQIDINLAELGLEYVERIYFATHGAWVADLPGGITIANLACDYAEGGSATTLDLTLGVTTAEWSHERREHDVFRSEMHGQVMTLYSFPTSIDSAFEYTGRVYSVDLDLDTSRTLSSLTLELVEPTTYIGSRLAPDLHNGEWAGHAFSAITLVGPAGSPDGGGPGPGPDEQGIVTGTVVDAQTGSPLAGVTVRVDGTGLSTTTDASGTFSISDVPAAGQTLVATLEGYVETTAIVLVLDGATTETSIGMLALGAGGDDVAAVLAWGQDPRDLDLHMSGPDGSGGRFHAYYASRTPVPHVDLDLDDTSSFGPETMTVHPAADGNYVAGDYHVWVHHFAGDLSFGQSAATVTLFAGGSQIAQYSVGGAFGDSALAYWLVVNFAVTEAGTVTNVSVQQSFAEGSIGFAGAGTVF